MAVESIAWSSRRPYEAGYEHRVGVAVIAVDPTHPANRVIVDLDLAARHADGLVRFEADVVLLAAPEPSGLLHVVANRGMVTALPFGSGSGELAAATGAIDPGDGWVLRRGLSVLWVGWQWDVDRRPGAVGLEAPEALGHDGAPLAGQARLGFQPVADTPRRRLADLVLPTMGEFRALPVADLGDRSAVLTERDWFNGPRRIVPRSTWRFPDAEHVELDGGFKARVHYELTYTTSRCPVTGAGLLAVRDVVAGLRPGHRSVLATGASQSGRWLRQFVHETGNADESANAVFDGVHCHIAGGRRGEFNHRYAQPSTMNPLGFSHLPPFSPSDGLLERAREAGTIPKLLFTNTATEYWRGDASLSHPDPEGPQWRCYLYAGAHHSGQMPGYVESLPVQLPGNMVNISWSTRAHFAALEAWVAEGIDPPPSCVPRPEDGTGHARQEVLVAMADAVGAHGRYDSAAMVLPHPEALLGMPPLDLGPDAPRGIGVFPPKVLGPTRPCLVSAVDADGNEVAGVRLPEVAVPVAVSLGWNPERPRPDVPVEVWNLVGGRIPFSRQEVLRRYGERSAYLARVREVTEELIGQRHLLRDDGDAVVAWALRLWDDAVGPGDLR